MNGMALPITALYAGVNTLIFVTLALWVIKGRRGTRTGYGDGEDKGLRKAIRAHGNNAEYVPLALILLALLEGLGVHGPWLHGFGIALTLARVAHPLGLFSTLGSSPGRFVGASVSLLLLILAGVACIVHGWQGL